MNVNARESSDTKTISPPSIESIQLAKNDIVIYPCGIYDGLHLGHLRVGHAAHCEKERNSKIGVLERKIGQAEIYETEDMDAIKMLDNEIERILTE